MIEFGCIDGLVQDCSNSSVLAMELVQSCTKPSVWFLEDCHSKVYVNVFISLIQPIEKPFT